MTVDETETVTIPAVTVTLKPEAWEVWLGDRQIGCVSTGVGYYFAQWLPYGGEHHSKHDTRDEAVAAVLAGGAR